MPQPRLATITGTQNDGTRPPSQVCCGDRVTSVARPLRIPTLGGGSIQFRSRLIPCPERPSHRPTLTSYVWSISPSLERREPPRGRSAMKL